MGLTPAFLARLARVGERLDDALRAPMRVWHARRMPEHAATAARLFMLHDAVSPEDARAALGDLSPLTEGGLIEPTTAGLVSRYHVGLAADVYCFGDAPGLQGDAVMPVCGATVDLARAAMPGRIVGSVLDVGCGAGAVGLLLARRAQRVVATDISARAIAFARVNAALNGVANIEFRAGDRFDPVRGERYDRIAAHPPFVARRDGATPSTFVHGGTRGDELPLKLLGEVAPHLASGARALMVADWPLVDGDEIHERIRFTIGAARVRLLVLQSPSKNLDDYCALHAAVEHRELGDGFARAAIAQRNHFEKLRVRGVAFAIVAVEPVAHGEPWTSRVAVRHTADVPISADAIDRLLAAHDLAHRGGDALGAARLRVPAGASAVEQPVPNGGLPSVILQLPPGRPEWPAVLDGASATIVTRIAQSPTVLDAARALARDTEASVETVRVRVESVARDALRSGALDIESH